MNIAELVKEALSEAQAEIKTEIKDAIKAEIRGQLNGNVLSKEPEQKQVSLKSGKRHELEIVYKPKRYYSPYLSKSQWDSILTDFQNGFFMKDICSKYSVQLKVVETAVILNIIQARKSTRKHWTRTEIVKLLDMRSKGMALDALAVYFGRTLRAITNQLYDNKPKTEKKISKEEKEIVFKLYKEGASIRDMAELVGCDIKKIENFVLYVEGAPKERKCRPWGDFELKKLAEMRQKGMAYDELAKHFNRTIWSVRNVLGKDAASQAYGDKQ
jgi:lambda repressor-like predicted transcriptional regulator